MEPTRIRNHCTASFPIASPWIFVLTQHQGSVIHFQGQRWPGTMADQGFRHRPRRHQPNGQETAEHVHVSETSNVCPTSLLSWWYWRQNNCSSQTIHHLQITLILKGCSALPLHQRNLNGYKGQESSGGMSDRWKNKQNSRDGRCKRVKSRIIPIGIIYYGI